MALLLGGDEVDDLRFRLHLPNDLADLCLRQLGLGEADAVELASQRSLNHGGLVGTKKPGDVIRGRLGGCGPGKRARSKDRQELRDAAAEVEPAAVARRPRASSASIAANSVSIARRRRTECLIQVDRLDKLLADQVILPRQFAVAGQRLLHAIGVAAAQRPGSRASIS